MTGNSTQAMQTESQAEPQRDGEWKLAKSPEAKRREAKEEKQMFDINSLTLKEV